VNVESGSSIVQAASNATQGNLADEAGIMVLKKAEEADAAAALGLIQALPKAPSLLALATEGKVGTQLNVFA